MEIYKAKKNKKKFFTYIQNNDWPLLHSHNYWEFIVVTQGSLIHKINGEKDMLQENDICLIRPQDTHSLHNLPKQSSCHLGIRFPDKFFKNYCAALDENLYSVFLKAAKPFCFQLKSTTVSRLIDFTHKVYTRSNLDEYEAYSSVLFIDIFHAFYYQFLKINNSENNSTYSSLVVQLINLINKPQNLKKDLYALLDELHYSYSHVNRIFTNEVGVSPSKYLKQQKMNYAKSLLTETNLDLATISKAIGYNNYSNFLICFKKEFHYSPNEYRELHKTQNPDNETSNL